MSKMYITFGQIHTHSVNGKTFDKDCVAVIECKDREQGDKLAWEYFNGVFHQHLLDDEFHKETLKYFPRGFINV